MNIFGKHLMKLNLGCGDKPLGGYTNVDLTSCRKGINNRNGSDLDVVECDIKNLNIFADNIADEILSVHVIEHFYYYEIHEILREWKRVLKPGSKLVIETPNLLTACKLIVEDPINNTIPHFPEGKRAMWPLYGNPGERDPLMCHKWLYTPNSLANLLNECGFVGIKKAKCQFKMREPRDMRIVCRKPE